MTPRQALTLSVRMTVLIALFIAAVFFLRIPISQSQTRTLATVPAASYELGAPVAPESIAAIFGTDLARDTSIVSTLPLPTELLGTSVGVRDSKGVERLAFLFFISPGQINCLIPVDTAEGIATITVRSGKGNTETGTVLVSKAAPSIFTANASGKGVPAAVAYRYRNGSFLRVEEIISYPSIVPAPIDLGPESDAVYLVLYLSGLRFVQRSDVRVLLGGVDAPDDLAFSPAGYAGEDQLNVRLPRSLIGRGRLKVTIVAAGRPSNEVEIEIGGRIVSAAPQITAINKTTDVLAGEEITLTGAQFAAGARDNVVKLGTRPATVTSASPGQLRIRVPYGAEGGAISVVTPQGEGLSKDELKIRTTISGFVKDTNNAPITGVKVTMNDTTVQTNSEGLFFISQVPANATTVFLQFDGRAVTGALFSDPPIKYRIAPNRDNLVETPVFLLQVNGAQTQIGSVLSGSPETQEDITLTTAAPDQTGVGELKFVVPAGTTIRFPNGATSGTLTLNAEPNGLTPIALPPDNFVSVIAQLAFFGATLNPGGKLIFPNPEQLPPGTTARLYQYDVAAGSPTRGDWVDLKDTVTVFADRIETSTNAIKQSTYYFIAAQRPVTTAIGRVIENNGTPEGRPVAGATVRIRGREAVTDGNGGFVLRNVGVNGDGRIFADVNLLRANGQVDSKQSAGVQAVLNGVTNLGTIVLATDATPNRPPTALIPASILVTAGQQFDQPFTASDPDPGQTISLQVSDTRLAGIIARGGNAYTLRLNPALSDANTTIKLTLTVTDNLGAAQSFDIAVIVRAPCSYSIAPTNQAFTANGGTGSITITAANGCAWTAGSNATWLTITAGASGNGNGTVSYAVAANTSTSPRTGTLTVAGQTFTVTQAGANPVPTLTSLNPSSVIVGGAAFTLTVNGSNFVAGAVVRWNGSNRTTTFAGSTQLTAQIPATDIAVAGTANVTVFNPAPGGGVSNTTAFTISSGLQWQQRTSGLTGGTVREFAVSGTNLFAGTYGGVFRSTDNGSTWTAVNNGLTHTYINALTVSGTTLFAGTDYGGGVFRSADNGSTWTAVNNGLTASSVSALAVSGSTLFAGTDGGVFRSADNGSTWTAGLTATRVFALAVSGSTLFAGTDGGVF
ncbi:MAG TPA: IPT/TIG domain-containing protein, partial [Blastocatellia bacterium]|nr:IPT/TIG domain-containing protein [Blastocatellia bacterium]